MGKRTKTVNEQTDQPLPPRTAAPEALQAMRERGGQWAMYENQALDSASRGHLQFLKFGPGCTYEVPPAQYPADTPFGLGWRYRHVGEVNLETGGLR